ncbi:MAG: peptide-methionine (S)-S-oxide reductase, partial [Methylocella sp.]
MLPIRKRLSLPTAAEALPGRRDPVLTAGTHFITGHAMKPPFPRGIETALFGMGCFWGAERKFWELGDGIHVTAAGYAGGLTPNPTYEEVCSGATGHNEVVLVAFEQAKISYEALLK